MSYWQHETPIKCPKRHSMLWLGSVYWICSKCRVVYVQIANETRGGDAHGQRSSS